MLQLHTHNKDNLFFGSDLHFGHNLMISKDGGINRPFETTQEMDEHLISVWNSLVDHNSEVYYLGDFGFFSKDKIKEILLRLNGGVINIIPGNHDGNILKLFKGSHLPQRFKLLSDIVCLTVHGKEIPIPKQQQEEPPTRIVMCHYPLTSWYGSTKGNIHLHGHTHGNLPPSKRSKNSLDVGYDATGEVLVGFDYVVSNKSKDQ